MNPLKWVVIVVLSIFPASGIATTQVRYMQQVNQAATITNLLPSSPSPVAGVPYSFVVGVASSNRVPVGSVYLSEGGAQIGTAQLQGSTATVNVAFTGGTHTVTACYTGNQNFAPSCAQPTTFTTSSFSLAAATQTGQFKQDQAFQTQVTVTPYGGFSGSVALACSGAPAFAVCTVNPSMLQLDGQHPSAAQVIFRLRNGSASTGKSNLVTAGFVIPLLCCFGLVPRLRRLSFRLLLVLGACSLVVGTNGCGSGYTKPFTYDLVVTASSGSSTQTIPLALTLEADSPSGGN